MPMKKNIIIIVLIAISGVFGVLSLINKIEANKQAEFAYDRSKEFEKCSELVKVQKLIAEKATEEAMRQRAIAEDLLQKYNGNQQLLLP